MSPMLSDEPMDRPGIIMGSDTELSNDNKTESNREKEILSELNQRIDNWGDAFSSLVTQFISNYDLYRGTGGINNRLNTKNRIFNPVLKQPIEDIISYLKTNPRSITLNIRGQKAIQDIINEILGKLMNDNHLYNKILKSFLDYLIYGVSLFKLESDSERVLNIKNIDIKNCIWDIHCEYDDFKPSFFIYEYLDNNFDTANRYGYKFTEKKADSSSIDRLNLTRDALLQEIKNTSNNSDKIDVYYGDQVFNDASKKVSKVTVNDGLSQILEYYVLENVKGEGNEVLKFYTKYTFVNKMLAEEVEVPYNSFPFISMAKFVNDADKICDMFDSKIADMKSEVLQINIIENSIADAISCNSNGALILKKSAILDKDSTMRDLKSGVIVLDESGDGKLSDVMVNLPPATISPVMIEQVNNLKNSIKSKLGLINFDPNMIQAKSGYHEAMRLDRESQSLSNMVSVIDNALGELGKKMFVFMQEYSKKSLSVLSSMSEQEDAKEILQDLSNITDLRTSINVSESKESPNNNMRRLNEVESIANMTGQSLSSSMSDVADALNVSEATKEAINKMNVSGNDPMKEAEIKEKNASAMSKEADAAKKMAEAQDISKGL